MDQPVSYFGAGPAKLPQPVLQQAAAAILNFEESGLSILELPHRSRAFKNILEEANALVNELCGLDGAFEILWLQGGGRLQFAMLPANFLGHDQQAGYIDSGHWAAEALDTARLYGAALVSSSAKTQHYRQLPAWPQNLPASLRYLHVTPNNTIYGTQWAALPDTGSLPLVADLSSDIFSRPRHYAGLSMFYAVAQKNLGPAGVTLVAIRKDFLQRPARALPPYLDYSAHVAAGGILNTLPVFPIYVCLLYLRWLKARGLEGQLLENSQKAALVYEAIDNSRYFRCPIAPADRSLMNVVFRGEEPETERLFAAYCRAEGLQGLEGHRSAGGFRASLYNGVSLQEAQKLALAIQNFKPETI